MQEEVNKIVNQPQGTPGECGMSRETFQVTLQLNMVVNQVKDLNDRLSETTNRLRTTEERYKSCQNEATLRQNKITTLTSKISYMSNEKSQLEQKISNVATKKQKLAAQNDELKREVSQLRAQVMQASSNNAASHSSNNSQNSGDLIIGDQVLSANQIAIFSYKIGRNARHFAGHVLYEMKDEEYINEEKYEELSMIAKKIPIAEGGTIKTIQWLQSIGAPYELIIKGMKHQAALHDYEFKNIMDIYK